MEIKQHEEMTASVDLVPASQPETTDPPTTEKILVVVHNHWLVGNVMTLMNIVSYFIVFMIHRYKMHGDC